MGQERSKREVQRKADLELHVAEHVERDRDRHARCGQEGRAREDVPVFTLLDVTGGVHLGIDDAAHRPHDACHSGRNGELQSRQGHEPELAIMLLQHVLVTTLYGIEGRLAVVVHGGVLRPQNRRRVHRHRPDGGAPQKGPQIHRTQVSVKVISVKLNRGMQDYVCGARESTNINAMDLAGLADLEAQVRGGHKGGDTTEDDLSKRCSTESVRKQVKVSSISRTKMRWHCRLKGLVYRPMSGNANYRGIRTQP